MFRSHTRKILFILAQIAPLASTGLSVYLKIKGPVYSLNIVIFFTIILVVCTGMMGYYTFLKPLKESSVIGRLLLKLKGDHIIKHCNDKGVEIRLNVLTIYRPAKLLFCARRFKIRWHLEAAGFYGDGSAEFGIGKGVAGEARRKGSNLAVNLEDPAHQGKTWGFTKRDRKRLQFPDHKMIWCFPIYQLDKNDITTSKILGTLNLDSLEAVAYSKLVDDNAVRDELETIMEEFQEIVMKIALC